MPFLLAALLLAADWQSEVRALRPADVTASEAAVLDEAQQRAKRALDSIQHAHTRQEADRQRGGLRRRLTDSLGVDRLPWPPDLKARPAGALQRPGYRIEKIVYQTLPGVLVAAHLYIPDNLKGRAPAILHYTGHWWEYGKAEPDFQAFCASMATQGFVVLIFEAFGQGERGVSARDHRRVEALLAGVSQQGFAEYETRCALHYLLSRKEVDPKRVGMTGASGGGYNTWINTSLDDRIAAAVTVVGTSDFYEQIVFARPKDFWGHAGEHCHFVPSLIRYANNHELLAMVAPKPLLVVAASEDSSFPIDGNREVYRYGRELYQSYRAPEKIGFYVDTSSGHGYQKKKREAAYGWFRRWLLGKGDGSPFAEPPVQTLPPDDPQLRCFPLGQNQAAGPGMIAAVKRLADAERPSGRITRWSVDAPSVRVSSAKVQRLLIPSDGLSIPAFLVRSASEKGVVLALDDDGKESLASDRALGQFLDAGWSVCGVDPRGIGEMAVLQKGWLAVVNLLLGDNLIALQAHDVARAGAVFRGKPIAVYARGNNAALAATYLIPNQEGLQWYILRDGFVSFRQFIERPKSLEASYRLRGADGRNMWFDREIPLAYFPFDALRWFDLPQLLSASAARGLVLNPINGDWESMTVEDNVEEAIGRFLNKLKHVPQGK